MRAIEPIIGANSNRAHPFSMACFLVLVQIGELNKAVAIVGYDHPYEGVCHNYKYDSLLSGGEFTKTTDKDGSIAAIHYPNLPFPLYVFLPRTSGQ